MAELNDYGGPFKPDLTFNDFSKEFLLKLMTVWQFGWIRMADSWYTAVESRYGAQAALDCNLEAWSKVAERVNPRYPKIANIQLNTVLDSLKCLQVPLDNNIGPLYPVEYEIKNPNHVIMTIVQCRSLIAYEKAAPEMIEPICHVLEEAVMKKYLINPRIKVTALKLLPRNSQEEIACRWEFKMSEGDG
jgi:hypothetical protein